MNHRLTMMLLAGALAILPLAAPGTHAADAAVPAATSVDEMPGQMRQAYIVGIQEQLQTHGYRPGPADGALGPGTRHAIVRYQRDAGLPVDGVASKELLDHLMFALPKVTAGTAPGPTSVIAEIQQELKRLGYYPGRVDGIAGPFTRAAVREFSQAAGLPRGANLDQGLLDQIRSAEPSLNR